MAEKHYVAYVGTYTRATSKGIHIYDIDPVDWSMTERKVVPINNPSDLAVSHNNKYLYSIADQGIQSFKILPDGDLEPMNIMYTGGLRGCYIEIDPLDKFIFVAGYHDGRISVLRINEDGTVGELTDGIFHKGIGLNITDRSSVPHVTCVKMSPDNKCICAVDSGLDQVKIYNIDYKTGKLTLKDILRCAIDSAPVQATVDLKRKYLYVLGQMSDRICIYNLNSSEDDYDMTAVQKISTVSDNDRRQAASAYMKFTRDGKHLFASNAGVNSVTVFDVDENGFLSKNCEIKCSGDYPKAMTVLPDNEHFIVLSHNTGEIFTYKMNYKDHYFLQTSRPIKVEKPNCIHIYELPE